MKNYNHRRLDNELLNINYIIIESEYFVRRCIEEFGEDLISVVLFGSNSRGLATQRSDMDFIIVLEGDVEEEKMRKLRLEFIMKFSRKIDTICLNRNDALKNFEYISPLFSTLLLGIKILYDRDNFFKEEIKKLAKKVKETKIKYYEGNKLWDLKRIGSEISL